ncbi:T9SS type A sorting domain-containing protein [Hymenobacter sp. BT770]|uniref:T9SS type A sorting domain-containing protein n=1 Tax=Hymenobacter sp. BT770 TaxID=2886942 RepID=UPI001D11D454|nr:T9SS type A sorting domain-containing protein [Hymenobacter sp. BT770]MCC3154257.1 T9SS type A sorting domain-containing protein [Hymenobacter sp. BT770]MDO3416363.1 T9SS type A sorting domain-containing protein [Hymenobacter sp. BT770]
MTALKRYLLFSLILVLTGFISTRANAQCVYTTTKAGNILDPSIYTGGCTAAPTSTSTIIINHAVTLSQDFSSSGTITINTGGSLTASVPNITLSLSNANLIIGSSVSRTPSMPQLSVGVLDLYKVETSVGANSVVTIGCTLNFQNQASKNFTLANNSLLIVTGNVVVGTGNPNITGPTTGVAGLRIVGNIFGNSGSTLFTTSNLITCVKGQPQPSGCVATTGTPLIPPPTNDQTCQNLAALPVTLTQFIGKRTPKGTVFLGWSTANEINNSFFEVERSADALNFVPLTKIAGSGNTTSARTYSFTDENPLAGQAYYRLRQIDVDGTDAYSPIVSIVEQKTAELAVFPNPSAGSITVPSAVGATQYRVLNVLGQAVLSGKLATNGRIELNTLNKGTFFLELTGTSGRSTQRLVRE